MMIVVREQGTVVKQCLTSFLDLGAQDIRRSGYSTFNMHVRAELLNFNGGILSLVLIQIHSANTGSLSSMGHRPREYLLMRVSQDHAKQARVTNYFGANK